MSSSFKNTRRRFHQDDSGTRRRLSGCRPGDCRATRRPQRRRRCAPAEQGRFACIGVGGKGDSGLERCQRGWQHRERFATSTKINWPRRRSEFQREEVLRGFASCLTMSGTNRRRHGEHARPHACPGRGATQ